MRVELRPEVMTRPQWPQAEVVILLVLELVVIEVVIRIRMSLKFQERLDFLQLRPPSAIQKW